VRCILVSLSSNILREIPTTLGEDGRHESTFPRVAPAVKSTGDISLRMFVSFDTVIQRPASFSVLTSVS
jgi:hypothetical protein